MAIHAQITKKNKSAISLQYLKNEVSDKVDFCMQIRMKVSYELRLWFWWRLSSIPKVPKIAILQCFYDTSKKVKR